MKLNLDDIEEGSESRRAYIPLSDQQIDLLEYGMPALATIFEGFLDDVGLGVLAKIAHDDGLDEAPVQELIHLIDKGEIELTYRGLLE